MSLGGSFVSSDIEDYYVTPVPRLVGRHVVVLDVAGDEAAAERAGEALVALRGQPFPVGLHLVARVNGGQRRGDPAGLERVRRIGAGADRLDAELFAGLHDRIADLEVLLVGTPDLKPGLAGHAMAQRVDATASDVDVVRVEELNVGERAAVQLLDHLLGVRSLDLEPVLRAGDRLAHRARR